VSVGRVSRQRGRFEGGVANSILNIETQAFQAKQKRAARID
jgi:hypothetical protein